MGMVDTLLLPVLYCKTNSRREGLDGGWLSLPRNPSSATTSPSRTVSSGSAFRARATFGKRREKSFLFRDVLPGRALGQLLDAEAKHRLNESGPRRGSALGPLLLFGCHWIGSILPQISNATEQVIRQGSRCSPFSQKRPTSRRSSAFRLDGFTSVRGVCSAPAQISQRLASDR
jgi:hypothetical protein